MAKTIFVDYVQVTIAPGGHDKAPTPLIYSELDRFIG